MRIFKISNRIVTSVFDSKRAQLFKIFEYLPSLISYLFNRMMPIFTLAITLSNQQNPLLTMVQVLYLLEVFILAHYGPPSTDRPLIWKNSNGHISARGHLIHFMFGSRVGFAGLVDRMVLFPVGPNAVGENCERSD